MSTADKTTYTLADLETWTRPGTHLAVLGHPIAHSLSPLMHNAALAEMATRDPRYRNWHYHRFDITPEDLPRALKIFHEKNFRGLNLTVPHKVLAFDCDSIAAIDPAAKPIGAINTLSWTPQGWHGYNTDGYGLATAIRETLAIDLAKQNVILLGAGGAARGAAIECIQRFCPLLDIANRTRPNLDTLLGILRPIAMHNCTDVRVLEMLDSPKNALVINATSSGLHANDPAPIDLAKLTHRPAAVFDMIYNPPQTPLLAQAETLGIPRANGLTMLIHQGARSLEIWTTEFKTKIPVESMRSTLDTSLDPKKINHGNTEARKTSGN